MTVVRKSPRRSIVSISSQTPPDDDVSNELISKSGRKVYDRNSYILIVDDDNTLLKFFKIHLNKFFSRVVVVKSASEAIKVLRDREIDLVVSDIRMPRVDGFELLRRVRKLDSSIVTLLVSGALLDDAQTLEVKNLADGYLRKPFSIDELHQFIGHGLQRRELFRDLSRLLDDPQDVREVVAGAKTLAQAISNAEHHESAAKLLKSLVEHINLHTVDHSRSDSFDGSFKKAG